MFQWGGSFLPLRLPECPLSRQRHKTNERATCCTPCFPPPAQVSIKPHRLSEGTSVFLIQTVGFIIFPVCCSAGGWCTPMEERSCFGITQEESRWPCLGGETDGVVPLKAQHQPTTRPTHPSTPSTPPDPTLIHSLNYSCTMQNPTKDSLRCRYRRWWWHVVYGGCIITDGFFFPSSCKCVHVS